MRASAWLAALVVLVASRVHAQAAEDDVPPPPPPAYQESIPPAPGSGASPPGPSQAAPTAAAAPPAAPAAPPDAESAGARVHDGFQLRVALGFGFMRDVMTVTVPPVPGEHGAKAAGGSVALHLGIGGEIFEGFSLGGFVLTESVTDQEVEIEDVLTSTVDVGTLAMLGVYVDYYLNPRTGFHFGGGLGGATLKTTTGSASQNEQQAGGGGGMLLVGYDWWVGNEWSIGVLARITAAGLRHNDITHEIGAFSALFSVAFQ